MKNKLLLFAFLIALSLPAFSQTTDSADFKNHFGIIASPSLRYLFQNNSLPVGLIYKRQTQPDRALRFTINGWYNKMNHPNWSFENGSAFNLNRTNYSLNFLIGYEKQQKLSKHWDLYYGADAGVGYSKSNAYFDFSNYEPAPNSYFSHQHWDNSTISFLLQPLAGIRFDVTSRLYLATETKIKISSGHSKDKMFETSFFENQTPVTKELNNASSTSLNVNYSPLSNIQLVYKF